MPKTIEQLITQLCDADHNMNRELITVESIERALNSKE